MGACPSLKRPVSLPCAEGRPKTGELKIPNKATSFNAAVWWTLSLDQVECLSYSLQSIDLQAGETWAGKVSSCLETELQRALEGCQ
jgi:hypothetical protein